MKRIELQWGIQDDALLAVLGVVAPAPRRGILALLDQPAFNIRSLPPLPAGLTGFTVLSIDLGKTYDQIIDIAKQANPQGADGFDQVEGVIRQRFGFDLRKDLLANLGPKLSFYAQAPSADVAANPAMAMIGQFTGLTISAQARDRSMAKVMDPLIQTINVIIQAQQAAGRRGQPAPNAGAIAFRKQDGPRPTYLLELPQGALPRRSWRCSSRQSCSARTSSCLPPAPHRPNAPSTSPAPRPSGSGGRPASSSRWPADSPGSSSS